MTADFTISWTDVRQPIDGFGASDRNVGTMDVPTADLMFNVSNGIGLSLLRASFDETGSYNPDSDPQNAVKAVARGAKVWAAPWSPPAASKTNADVNNGGHLLAGSYGSWSDLFVSFYNTMRTTYGINLVAMSVQNEPDFSASYPSCIYTNAEMVAFMKVLGPKLAVLSPAPLLMSPEAANWGDMWSGSPDPNGTAGYGDYILNDSLASSLTGIIATHDYTYATVTHSAFSQKFWETEVSSFEASDASLSNALTVASWVHRALDSGNVSAWHYWEFNGTLNQGLLWDDLTLTKRLFAVGNWSRFVRPGWVRLDVAGSVSGMSVTAFRNPLTRDWAVVVVNASGSAATLSFTLGGVSCSAPARVWVTAGTAVGAVGSDGNLSQGSSSLGVPAIVSPSASKFSVLVEPGVTTLTGTADGSGGRSASPLVGSNF